MADRKYESQKRWNTANYKQFNFSISPSLAESFRAACEGNGNSMRKAITEFMVAYTDTQTIAKAPINKQYDNRKLRRKAVKSIASQLEDVRDAEVQYK